MSDPHADSATTRYLCAGVYTDRALRYLIIRKIHNNSRRRVAPSYGFDLVPVIRHAWWAWFLDMAQLLAMLGCLIGGLMLGGALATVIIGCAIVVCALLRGITRVAAQVVRLQVAVLSERWGERREPRRRRRTSDMDLQGHKRLLKAMLIGCLVVAVTPIVVSNALGVSLVGAARPATAIGCTLVVCAIVVGVLRQLLLNSLYHAEWPRPESLTRREEVIDQQQNHPYVIYHRPPHKGGDVDPLDLLLRPDAPSPFIGSGKLVNRWLPPMTVQLFRPGTESMAEREYTRSPFDAHKLVERLRKELERLATDPGAEHLPGLRVRDRIYIAESDFPVADRVVLGAGVGRLQLWGIVDDHSLPRHHFLETSVPIAGGELVTTVLLRVSLKGRCLSLDVATCALTRTPNEYHRIYGYGEHGPGAVLRSAMRSVFALPVDALRTWRLAEIPLILGRAWWAIKDRTVVPRRRRGIGPRVAVREETADVWENAQLDRTTIYDHMKIIEQRILKSTEDFLKDNDVDTSAFQTQATNIINSGVLNMGSGPMEINQAAIGASAQFILAAGAEGRSA